MLCELYLDAVMMEVLTWSKAVKSVILICGKQLTKRVRACVDCTWSQALHTKTPTKHIARVGYI